MAASSSQDPLFEVVLCRLTEFWELDCEQLGWQIRRFWNLIPATPTRNWLVRGSLMTGHGGTVVLAVRIRLLVVWTLRAYHYSFRLSVFLPIFPLSSLFVPLGSLSLLLLQPRTNREVYLSCCRLFRPKESQCALWRQSLRARIAQVVEEVRSGGLRRGKVDPKHVKVRERPKWNTWETS